MTNLLKAAILYLLQNPTCKKTDYACLKTDPDPCPHCMIARIVYENKWESLKDINIGVKKHAS